MTPKKVNKYGSVEAHSLAFKFFPQRNFTNLYKNQAIIRGHLQSFLGLVIAS